VELGGALKNVLVACGELMMTRCALAVDQLSGPEQHSSGCSRL